MYNETRAYTFFQKLYLIRAQRRIIKVLKVKGHENILVMSKVAEVTFESIKFVPQRLKLQEYERTKKT